jgi:hypothetical protein
MFVAAHGAAAASCGPLLRAAAGRRHVRAHDALRSAAEAHRERADAQAQELFLALWQEAGCWPATSPVVLARTRLGRGLVVRLDGAALEAGDLVVSLPWSAVLSVTDGDTAEGPADARLARALLRATGAAATGAAAGGGAAHPLWARYAALLPSGTGAAALWHSELLDELQSPPAVDAAQSARLHFRTQAARLQTDAPLDSALWAMGMVHSRSFALELPGEGRFRALAPLADLINNEQASAADAAGGGDDEDESPWRMAGGRFELRAPRRFLPGAHTGVLWACARGVLTSLPDCLTMTLPHCTASSSSQKGRRCSCIMGTKRPRSCSYHVRVHVCALCTCRATFAAQLHADIPTRLPCRWLRPRAQPRGLHAALC